MQIKLNNLSDNPGAVHKSKRLGRGIGSGKGKTCGRGHKGQKARSGVAIKNFEGGQMSLIKRLPKRGFTSINKRQIATINLKDIQLLIERKKIISTDIVNKETLINAGVFKKSFNHMIKILGNGDITTSMNFDVDLYSDTAKQKIHNIGGKCL